MSRCRRTPRHRKRATSVAAHGVVAPVLHFFTVDMLRRTPLAALALAFAAATGFAAEHERAPAPQPQPGRAEVTLPGGLVTVPVGKALESLSHLRLRPAQNGLDISDTAHRPATHGAE